MTRGRPSDQLKILHEIPRVEWRWADEERWRAEPIDQFVDRFDGSLTERDVVAAIKKRPEIGADFPVSAARPGMRIHVRAAR